MVQAYVVRYGRMRFLGECRASRPGPSAAASGSSFAATAVPSWVRSSVRPPNGRPGSCRTRSRAKSSACRRPRTWTASRLATEREQILRHLREFIARRRLQMDLVDVEVILGGERVVFYYLAEKRVDFRELVKDLARALRTRIEMRQIGVRDEAKLLADYGDCGKPVCCNTHLSRMPPVSMRMAKMQKATLDPTKISGRCGRLKCCLRYEYDTYRELETTCRPSARTCRPRGAGPGCRPGDPRPESGRRVRGSPAGHRRPRRHPRRRAAPGAGSGIRRPRTGPRPGPPVPTWTTSK